MCTMEKLPDDVDAAKWGRVHLRRYFTNADPKPEDVDAEGFESFLYNRQVLYDLGFTPANLIGLPFVVISAMGAWFEDSGTTNLPIARGQIPSSLWGAHVYDTEGWRARGFLGFEPDKGGTRVPLYIDDDFYDYEPSVLLNINTQTKGAGPKFWRKLKEQINDIYATETVEGESWGFKKLTPNIKAQVYKVFIEPLLDPSNLDPEVVQLEMEEARRRQASAGGAGPAPSVPPAAAAGISRSTGIVVEDSDDEGVKKRGDEDRLQELKAKLKEQEEEKAGLLENIAKYRKILSDEMPELKSRKLRLPGLRKDLSDTEGRLPGLRKDLSDTEGRLPGLRKDLSDTERRLLGLRKDLSDTERRLPGLKQEVSTVERRISELEHRVAISEKKIKRRTEQISVIDATIARLQEEIEDLTPIGERGQSAGGAGPAPSVPPAAATGISRSTAIVVEDSNDERGRKRARTSGALYDHTV